MNIFFLDQDPGIAAQYHCDKHVIKMILETAQILSTANRVLDGKEYKEKVKKRNLKRWKLDDCREDILYKATHVNHPCAIWARECSENYLWLYDLFVALNWEYTNRFRKTHKSMSLGGMLAQLPKNIPPARDMTFPALAMPEHCRVENDPVLSYRIYYVKEKSRIASWYKNKTLFPPWWKDIEDLIDC